MQVIVILSNLDFFKKERIFQLFLLDINQND